MKKSTYSRCTPYHSKKRSLFNRNTVNYFLPLLIRIFIICFTLSFVIGISSATNFYVSTNGNNGNNGLDIENAWQNISYGVTQLYSGDTLYIANGTWYDEHVIFPRSGTSIDPIVVTAYNGTPILDGVDKTGNAFLGRGKSYISISGIDMTNYKQGIQFDGWYINGYYGFTEIHVSNVKVSHTSGQAIVYTGFPNHCSITNSTVIDNGWNSIAIYGTKGNLSDMNMHTHNITLDNIKVFGPFGHSAIDLFGELVNITVINSEWNGTLFSHPTSGEDYNNSYWNISNNYIHDSPSHGMYFTSDDSIVSGNIVTNTSGTGIKSIQNMYNTTFSNNIIHSNAFSGFDIYGYDLKFINNSVYNHTIASTYDYRVNLGNGVVTNANSFDFISGETVIESTFYVAAADGSMVEIEFTDGSVFSENKVGSPTYYPNKSNYTISNDVVRIITYPMTACPTTASATITVNKFDTSLSQGNILIDITANTTDGNNVVFTVNELQPNHYYLIKKDGANFTTTQANSTGYIQFGNSEWSEHTFTIEEVSQPVDQGAESDAFVSITPSTLQTPPSSQFTLTIPITPATPITGAQFDLNFDNSLATVTIVTEGNLFNQDGATTLFNSGTINNAAGTVTSIYGSILGETSVSTQGSFATIGMTAGSTTGYLNLNLANIIISDADSNAAPYTLTNATILIDTAPVLSSIGAKSVGEGSVLTFTLDASDADGDSLTYTTTNLPAGASFNTATGVFLWTPANGDAGTYAVTFEATDGYLNDSGNVTITVNNANNAPVITTFVPANSLIFNELDVITVGIIASDADGDALTYNIKIDGVTKSTSSNYVWETDYSSAGTHTIDITVSDGVEQVTDSRTITINDVQPRWDVNEDGTVDVLDISVIGQKYGASVSAPYPRWDVNQDGGINVQDMALTGSHFGETVA